jgi:hypothetical protein
MTGRFREAVGSMVLGAPAASAMHEALHSITLYHGTSLASAKKIVKAGLKALRGGGPLSTGSGHAKAVYLTGDKGTAARYATGSDYPVVIEVRISSPRRIASLTLDPMDNPEVGWNSDSGSYDYDPEWAYLFQGVAEYAKKQGWDDGLLWSDRLERLLPHESSLGVEVEKLLRGYNLYKSVSQWLRRRRPVTAPSDLKRFRGAFRSGEYGTLHLSNSGSVRLDSSHFSDLHQVQYSKGLPPSAVKRVWVPESVASGSRIRIISKGKEEVSVTRLGGEAKALLDRLKDDAESYTDRMLRAEDDADRSDLQDVIDEISRPEEDPGDFFSTIYLEWMSEILALARKMVKTDPVEWPSFHGDIREAMESVMYGYDENWGNDDFASYLVPLVEIRPADLARIRS